MEDYIGEIRLFAGNFAPENWAFCQGQLMTISENSALYSLLGTNYGGDGRSTFRLPDFRGRAPMSPGQGPGLENINLGQQKGVENVTLTSANTPAHAHNITNASLSVACGNPQNANTHDPTGSYPATVKTTAVKLYDTTFDNQMDSNMVKLAPGATTSNAGGTASIGVRNPCVALNFIICTQGIYPSRS